MRRLTKSAGIIGLGTALSRILGFVRDIVIAACFGTGPIAQAFVVAWRLPNMLREMIGEGAANAAIVPVLSACRKKSEKEFQNTVSNLLNVFSMFLILITIAGILCIPVLVRLLAPGMSPELSRETIILARYLFPYLFFIGLTAFSMGVLNSMHHFSVPAFSQVIFNFLWIICVQLLANKMPNSTTPLVVGVLVGGLGQLLMNVPTMYRYGVRIKMTFNLADEVVRKVVNLLIPRIAGAGMYQVSTIIGSALASLSWIVGDGAIAAFYFSNRLIQLPLAVFGVSLAQAALPTMSEHVAVNEMDKFKDVVKFSLNAVFLVSVPATVGLIILANPIVSGLFQGGKFDAYSSMITANALIFSCFGLVGLGGIKILVSPFFAMHDTKTPLKTAFISLLANVVFGVILMWPLKIGGIALATSIAANLNFVLLFYMLVKRVGDIGIREIGIFFLRVLGASLLMGVVTYLMSLFLLGDSFSGGRLFKLLLLTVIIIASCISYTIFCHILGIKQIKGVLKWITKKS